MWWDRWLFQLLNFIQKINDLISKMKKLQELNREMNFYRRTNQNLKKFIEEKNDLANQEFQILERKITYELIIYYSILLIIV